MSDNSPSAGGNSDEERALAAYLNELISATLAKKTSGGAEGAAAAGGAGKGRGATESQSAGFGGEELEESEAPAASPASAPTSGMETSQQDPPPSGSQKRGTTRASMREELLALFRATERPSRFPPSASEITSRPRLTPPPQPSVFLRRFLRQATRSPELAPSGLGSLDARLGGGFGSGLHVVLAPPGVGKTAFLESVAWEAVSTERPVLYYALKEGNMGAWERLISTLGAILGGPTVPLDALRAHALGGDDLETLSRVDLALQASVLPYLSLVDTISAYNDILSAFIEDLRSRGQEAQEQHGRIPLLLVDDLKHLLPLPRVRPLVPLLSRLDDALVADLMPGLLAITTPDESAYYLERLPVQTTLVLGSASTSANDAFGCVGLEVRTSARTGWTGTLPLLLDRGSGLFTPSPISG
jgi:hypothetical protein